MGANVGHEKMSSGAPPIDYPLGGLVHRLQVSIMVNRGGVINVLLHLGHLPGLLVLSRSLNLKPQSLHSAGMIDKTPDFLICSRWL